jgi:hypothetical protein
MTDWNWDWQDTIFQQAALKAAGMKEAHESA